MKNLNYFAVYKPYGMISQFTPEIEGDITLRNLYKFPTDVYPIGRLDKDSEGLLILSNDPKLNSTILNPVNKFNKAYWVQVEGIVDLNFLKNFSKGVQIKLKDKFYTTKPCEVILLNPAPETPERIPPIRTRKNIPTSWIEVKLHEGKNRQIRKMCAILGYPVLRIIRIAVGKIKIENLQPGEFRKLTKSEIMSGIN
ncbi:MAG: pseudouridine synthase [Saprospiraceae bacterium]